MINTAGSRIVRPGDDAQDTWVRALGWYQSAKISGDWSAITAMRVDSSHVELKDMGAVMERERSQPRVLDGETQGYFRYLERKMLIAVSVVMGSVIVGWVAALNLTLFLRYEIILFHPAISVYLLVASIGLIVVALASMYTGWRYFRETVRTL
jgi:hypothetical protein